MWIYMIILGVIWVGLLIPVVREHRAWIACAHGGTGLFFTSLLLSLGLRHTGDIANIVWLEIIGFVLFIPAALLIASAMVAVAHGELVKTGMMRIVRHPMYLGTAIASFALILIFQSILSIVFSTIAIVLLWMASKMEDNYNIERFGDSYSKHYVRVEVSGIDIGQSGCRITSWCTGRSGSRAGDQIVRAACGSAYEEIIYPIGLL